MLIIVKSNFLFFYFLGIFLLFSCYSIIIYPVWSQNSPPPHPATTAAAPTGGGDDNNECESMKNPNANNQKRILCVGQLTEGRLLVVTRDYHIFLLPLESIDNSLNKLYVNGTKPTRLEEEWPNLAKHPEWDFVSKNVHNAFTRVDPENEHNYFFTSVDQIRHPEHPYGLKYEITTSKVYPGYCSNVPINHVNVVYNLISFYKSYKYYALTVMKVNNKQQTIFLPAFKESDGNTIFVLVKTQIFVCASGNGGIIFQKSPCNDPVKWDMMTGAVINTRIYLFGPTYVISFPVDSVNNSKGTVNYIQTDYNNWINCDGHIDIKINPVLTEGKMMLMMMIIYKYFKSLNIFFSCIFTYTHTFNTHHINILLLLSCN